uniref:AC2 n=1 Tax=Sweet potato leaf curl Hubei virus TaxID=2282485 RepID=A0A4V1G8N8_9GEMI|nr:AC2 [Sweet potato leaf curl Hubei virus]
MTRGITSLMTSTRIILSTLRNLLAGKETGNQIVNTESQFKLKEGSHQSCSAILGRGPLISLILRRQRTTLSISGHKEMQFSTPLKRTCSVRSPSPPPAPQKRKYREPRTRLTWFGCGCSAFISPDCKFIHGFTHKGVTKSCTDWESCRIQQQSHVCGSDCTIPPACDVHTHIRKRETDHEGSASTESQPKEEHRVPKDLSPIPDYTWASQFCYSQLDFSP